jgi:hypothetical protein
MALADILLKGARGAKVPQSFLPLLQQAISEAAVRYEPEYQQLNAVREQSAQTMRQRISQANSAAQLQSALANETLRNVNANTNPAISRLMAQQGAPAGSSQAVVAENLGLTGQGINALLSQAAANAPIRAQQQGLQALGEHQSDLDKINSQRSGLVGQAGTYITGRYGDLVGTNRSNRAKVSAQKRQIQSSIDQTNTRVAAQERGQDISHQDRQDSITQRRQAAAQRAADKKTPAKTPRLSPAATTKYESQARQVADILNHPPKLKNGGTATREQIISEIRSGTSPLGKGVDPRIINIGLSLADNRSQGIGPWGAGQARSIGLDPKRFGKQIPRPKRTPPAGPAGPLT